MRLPLVALPSVVRAVGIAVLVTSAAVLIRKFLLDELGTRLVWITFYPAVVLAAFYGGWVSGVLTTVTAPLIAVYAWPWLVDKPFIFDYVDRLGLIAFLINAAMIVMVAGLARRERNRALQAKERLDILLDTSPDPMLSVATDGRIVRANRMAERFFGYANAELLAMTVEQLVPERFRRAHETHRRGYFADPRHRPMGGNRHLKARTRNGCEPDVEISLSHSGEGKDQLATITVRDVTERERNRYAMEQAHRNAENALARQREMQDILVQAEKMAALGGLVAGVAHEINTPVGVSLSSATHLEAETIKADALYRAGELTEEGLFDYFATARQATRLMTINSQRANNLIQSFKQVAVDQAGGERRRFDLALYLDEILLSLLPSLKKHNVQANIECPPDIEINSLPGALSQVLTNLIINSLTHAFAPGQAGNIAIFARLAEDDQIKIVYSDDGCGIPAGLHGRIFEPFFTTRRSEGGSGLGLHIVFNIMHQTLMGSITLDTNFAAGTRFIMRFPRVLTD
jgi:PAS domain S-box-containing protein